MALRVLLADESSTIKKVFQLALQDFAVEVRPVNIGLDVATVAQSFKPDIIFADVLLQKKNGYEVALELKQNPTLKNIPVVLMWSGFVELDQDKFEACLANSQLEKPFDVSALRKLIIELVPKTQSQRISQFLSFPEMPELEDTSSSSEPASLPDDDEQDDFQHVPIPKMNKPKNADKFRLDLKPEELDPDHVPVSYDVPTDDFSFKDATKTTIKPDALSIADEDVDIEFTSPSKPLDKNMNLSESQLSEAQIEKIIRQQSPEIIESVVWRVVPELAKQIIERELNRLLKERDSVL